MNSNMTIYYGNAVFMARAFEVPMVRYNVNAQRRRYGDRCS